MVLLLALLSAVLFFPKSSWEVEPIPEPPMSFLESVQTEDLPESVLLQVPFTSQAPFKDWSLPYQEACEEASLIMVNHFWNGESLSPETADQAILELVDWETANGFQVDVNAEEMLEIAEEHYALEGHLYYDEAVNLDTIRHFLAAGYPVILPVAGQLLGNPHFTGAGPPYHVIVLIGYDANGFLVNDPGTQFGASYHYSYERLDAAIHDWTGSKSSILNGRRAMLVFSL